MSRMLRGIAVFVTTVAAVTGLTAAAAAAPGSSVSVKVISQQVDGDTNFVVAEVTLPPGGASGWHYHDGPVIGHVVSGKLTRYNNKCVVDRVYRAGAPLYEPTNFVHDGRNHGRTPVVLQVMYVLPKGKPFLQSVPAPACDRR